MELDNKLWPFDFPPRNSQNIALNWLEQQKVKYIILEAPVGVGKSNIGIALSKFLGERTRKGDAYILTPQKILQKQYEDSFADIPSVSLTSLYGKSNYNCHSKNATCDVGSLVKPRCSQCTHQVAKKKAMVSPNTVMNYKLGLLLFAFGKMSFKPRKLLILDECHTLEQHLIEFDAVVAAEWRAKKMGVKWKVAKTFDEGLAWFEDPYLSKARDYLVKLGEEVELLVDNDSGELSRSEIKKLREYNKLQDHVDEVEMFILQAKKDESIKTKWVYTSDKLSMSFKRLTGAYSFKNIIDPIADRILFMSSTILNKEGFCRDLGIDPEQTAFLSLDSDFTSDKRPIYYMPQMKMNASWTSDSNIRGRRTLINKMLDILEMHKNDSGIIHTGNYAIAKWLVDELKDDSPQQIYHHNPDSGDDRNDIITAFQFSPKPGILISPSITEGLDLKGDLSRFAIFAKVPFGNLGDAWIKRRLEMSAEWYSRRALIDIIQGGGRIVRDEDDWGNVYILDESFGYLHHKTKCMIPQWWKDAYHVDSR